MGKINKNIRLSWTYWTQARISKYAERIVKVLREKGIKMVMTKNGPTISWSRSKKGTENLADVEVAIIFDDCHSQPSADIIVSTSYPFASWENWFKKMVIEKINDKVAKIYPLTNYTVETTARKTVLRPVPAKEVARQLCMALECYKVVNDQKTNSAIKKVNELAEKEADKLVRSLFK